TLVDRVQGLGLGGLNRTGPSDRSADYHAACSGVASHPAARDDAPSHPSFELLLARPEASPRASHRQGLPAPSPQRMRMGTHRRRPPPRPVDSPADGDLCTRRRGDNTRSSPSTMNHTGATSGFPFGDAVATFPVRAPDARNAGAPP